MKKMILTLALAVASAAVADIPAPRRPSRPIVRYIGGFQAVKLWNSLLVQAVQLPSTRLVTRTQKSETSWQNGVRKETTCVRTTTRRARSISTECTVKTYQRPIRLG